MFKVRSFLVMGHVVAGSDLIATLPRRLAEQFVETLDLQLLTLPFELQSFSLVQFWDERRQRDPAHAWFRGLVREILSSENL